MTFVSFRALPRPAAVRHVVRLAIAAALACIAAAPVSAQDAGSRRPELARLAVGSQHACAVRGDGAIACWGRNTHGQLGDGTTQDRTSPVLVVGSSGLLDGFVSVAAGASHTCGLRLDGTVFCWGSDLSGQLGNGAGTLQRPYAMGVDNIADAVSITAGREHTCAVRAIGEVWCWGANDRRQLGNNEPTNVLATRPVNVWNLTDVVSASAGGDHTCAVRANGQIACWGRSDLGQLGNGSPNDTGVPVTVSGISTATDVAAGGVHTCARLLDGAVRCWGFNNWRQLGTSSVGYTLTPVLASVGATATDVAGSANTVCARLGDGGVRCWGDNRTSLIQEEVYLNAYRAPTPMPALAGVAEVRVGETNACARRSNGDVVCWGDNQRGQNGNGSTTSSHLPVAVAGLNAAGTVRLAAGADHACAVRTDGGALCWGRGDTGQLGNGTTARRLIPTEVAGLGPVVAMATGAAHTCALRPDGTVACWGANDAGQLGDGTLTDRLVPVATQGLSSVQALVAGASHTCALRAEGEVWCWGAGTLGQLGTGGQVNSPTPERVSSLVDAVALSAGRETTCALRVIGEVWCWGVGSAGQLGNNATARSLVPTNVWNVTDAAAIALADRHGCAVSVRGRVVCWGSTFTGNGTSGQSLQPGFVSNLDNAVSISARGEATCARRATGTLACWGRNDRGNLGDGTFTTRYAPVAVSGLYAASVVTGHRHACAGLADGTAACWGGEGLVGDGTLESRTTPVPLLGGRSLPVDLVDFTAVADGDRVRLTWTTESETRNAAFVVEHQGPAGAAVGAWREHARQPGRGTTSARHDYAVTTDVLGDGLHRFRLRQIDLDGTATLSSVVEVQVGGGDLRLARAGERSLRVASPEAAVFVLVDVLGREVVRRSLEPGEATVDVSTPSRGAYVARVVGTSGRAAHLALVLR